MKKLLFSLPIITVLSLSACFHDKTEPGYEYAPQMYRPIAYNPDQPNPNFKDGKTAQLPVEGTLSLGQSNFPYENNTEGYEKAGLELKNPLETNEKILAEGKLLYTNMCTQCHGEQGRANGAVVASGKFPPPPAYQSDALKNLPEGKIFFSITYGKNLMGSHASQLNKEERWKVVRYVQYLQNIDGAAKTDSTAVVATK